MAEKGNGGKTVTTVEMRPVGLFERLEREMDDLRHQMFGAVPRPFFAMARPTSLMDTEWAPTADAYEKNGTYVIKAELPGVKKDDVKITLADGLLTVDGKREEEKEVNDARYHTRERFLGSFSRTFVLPEGFDADKIGAEFKNGVIEVRVPLPATAKETPTTIPVNG